MNVSRVFKETTYSSRIAALQEVPDPGAVLIIYFRQVRPGGGVKVEGGVGRGWGRGGGWQVNGQ